MKPPECRIQVNCIGHLLFEVGKDEASKGKMVSSDFLQFVLFVLFVVPSAFNPSFLAKFPPFLSS
jgi:hypothetical protein